VDRAPEEIQFAAGRAVSHENSRTQQENFA
jgi:hypothetical protein